MNHEFIRRVFEVIPGYLSVQDRNLRLVAANQLFRKDFGGEMGDHCYEIYKGRTEPCAVCPVERTFRDGKVHSSEELVISRSGERKEVIVYTGAVRNEAGEIEAVVELSTDITKVTQLKEKFRMLFEEVPCYISVHSRDLRILETNRRFRADFGDGIGERCYAVYKHRTEPCLGCPVAQTFEDGQVHTSEELVTSLSGKQVHVLCSTAALRDTTGAIESVMEMSTNITELRKVQSQLTSLGMLLGSVAHGIKGLLSGLDGGLYLMDTGFDKGSDRRITQGRQMIRRNVDRIRNMVLNLLYYAKDRQPDFLPVDLEELIESVGRVMARRAEQAGVELDVQAQPGEFIADHDALHSVLINLVENSLDACRVDKEKRDHHVGLKAHIQDGKVRIVVVDNGVGMDQETKEKALSLFFTSKGNEGTGLGLFIAQKIVAVHTGSLHIESLPGQGTRFVVVLPQQPGREGGMETAHNPSGVDVGKG